MSVMNDDKPWQHDANDREWAEVFRQPGDRPAECPSPDLIQAARADVLSPALRDTVSAHVSGCITCRVLAESLDAIGDGGPTAQESRRMLQRVRAATDAAAARPGHARWWLSLTAAAALTVIVAWWLTGSPGKAPAPSVFQVQARVILPLESSMEAAEAADLAVALVPYRAGRFEEATRSLAAYIARHPRNAYGHFYLGVAELARASDRDALVALESAERLAAARPHLAREVAWHLAVTYRRLGQDDKALPRLAMLCGDGAGLEKACTAIRELIPVINIDGIATDSDGRALDGVRIIEHVIRAEADFLVTEPTAFSTTTGAGGRYRLSGAPATTAQFLLRASRPGYFTANAFVAYAPTVTADFVLHPWRVVAIGENIRSRTVQDGLCDPAEPCQRYAVTPDRSGTLEMAVVTANRASMDLYVETPDGRVYGPHLRAPLQLAFPVTAGSTLQIRVLSLRPADFELQTRFR